MLLRKGVYSYEYTDKWKKFNETSLPEKYDFYSNLNIEDIKDSDYNHEKRVCNDFQIKNLTDFFEDFRKMSSEIYQLRPAKFLSAPGLAWQTTLKRTRV